jgi:hypothetical protein
MVVAVTTAVAAAAEIVVLTATAAAIAKEAIAGKQTQHLQKKSRRGAVTCASFFYAAGALANVTSLLISTYHRFIKAYILPCGLVNTAIKSNSINWH